MRGHKMTVFSNYVIEDGKEYNQLACEVLINPSTEYTELKILSGYASPDAAFSHFTAMEKVLHGRKMPKIELICGMSAREGVSYLDHEGFKKISSEVESFNCKYMKKTCPPSHVKLYIWYKNGVPKRAFIGSANYSLGSFFMTNKKEALSFCDPVEADEYFQAYGECLIDCMNPDVNEFVNIGLKPKKRSSKAKESKNSITLTLLNTRTREVPERSGLNWGQRPEVHRDPNQAYIAIPRSVVQSKPDFFPPKKVAFKVITDDEQILFCTVSGNKLNEPPKQFETTYNNAELGKYFRKRLGLPSGAIVTTRDLRLYGRSDIELTKINDDTYYLDFSKPGQE